jgi:hypothetical protein
MAAVIKAYLIILQPLIAESSRLASQSEHSFYYNHHCCNYHGFDTATWRTIFT